MFFMTNYCENNSNPYRDITLISVIDFLCRYSFFREVFAPYVNNRVFV